jgi:hypothetical protein
LSSFTQKRAGAAHYLSSVLFAPVSKMAIGLLNLPAGIGLCRHFAHNAKALERAAQGEGD